MTSLKQQAVRGTRWTGISTGCVFVLQILQTGLLARLLEPRDFGIIAVAYVAQNVGVAVADFGFGNLLVQKQNLDEDSRSSVIWLMMGFSALVAAALFAGSFLLPESAFGGSSEQLSLCLRIISGYFLFLGVSQPFLLQMQKQLRFAPIALAETSAAIATLCLSYVLALQGFGAYSLAWGMVGGMFVKACLITIQSEKKFRPKRPFSPGSLRAHLRFGLFQLGEKCVNILFHSSDKILIGSLLNTVALGHYSLAYRTMTRPISLMHLVLSRVGFPLFSGLQKDDARTKQAYFEILKFVAFYLFPLNTLLFLVADDLILLWLGPGWGLATELFQILLLLGIFIGLSNPVNNYLLGRGRVGLSFGLNIMGFVLNASTVWVCSFYGIRTVAWGLVCSMGLFMFLVDLVLMYRLQGIKPAEILGTLAPFASYSLAVLGVCHFLKGMFEIENVFLRTGITLLSSGALYLVFLVVFQRNYLKRLREL